ncbi:reverse transcriptase domain-containing protein [Tanacetum coccineum]
MGDKVRLLEELLQIPTKSIGDAIVIPPVLANEFELKPELLNLISTKPFYGFENDDPYSYIKKLNQLTQTFKLYQVPQNMVKLILFPFSLEGAAREWLENETPNSITSWSDLVLKFVNKFYPYSRTHKFRNEITQFCQTINETFGEAWERFKDLLRKCRHHGFTTLYQIDTFYNGLDQLGQDLFNLSTGGNLFCKHTQEALRIIENISKVRPSHDKPQVIIDGSTSRQSNAINALTQQVQALGKQFENMKKVMNVVQEVYDAFGGSHPTQKNVKMKDTSIIMGRLELFRVFCIWKAFGRITRDMGSFGEEMDKTTDLHQHFSRLSSQQLETASQFLRDTVTMHPTTASHIPRRRQRSRPSPLSRLFSFMTASLLKHDAVTAFFLYIQT